MNVFSFLFFCMLICLNGYITVVTPTFLKSENSRTLFCYNNACLNNDNKLLQKLEPEGVTIVRTSKDISEKPEQSYQKENEVTMDQHKTFLENKYMNIETKKKTFEGNKNLEEEKILSGTSNKLEKNLFSKALETLSLTLETTSSKIKEEEEHTSLNENVPLKDFSKENITQSSPTNEMEAFPTFPLNIFEVLSYNLTSTENICFCDLTLNHCDINCCCDKDCNTFHWKVFTRCSDLNSYKDLNYCFETIFLFKNNTKVKKKQLNNGLFCVVNKNIKPTEVFKAAKKEQITSLTTFKMILPKKFFSFSPKTFHKVNFRAVNYQIDSYIWVFEYGVIKPFGIYKSNLDLSCLHETYIKYMRDQKTVCSIQNFEGNKKCTEITKNEIVYYLKNLTVIASPHQINESENLSYGKVCNDNICLQLELYICLPLKNCVVFSDEVNFSSLECSFVPLKIQYEVLHNGSEGIKGFKAYIWFEDTSGNFDRNYIQTSEVKFIWTNSSQNIFKRSGNPGYLIGKPLLAGKKINFNSKNDTIEKKSFIELTSDSGNSLNVMSSKNGICLLDKRIPINFQENAYYTCNVKLKTDENFNKEKCAGLQNLIFQYLIGKDVANITKDNFFNKFVASFGNARSEDAEAWVPVLTDLLPFVSSQVSFKSGYNYFICSNIVSDLTINVVYSNVGSFQNPQSKILGVLFQLGTYKDILFHCDAPNCEGNNIDKNLLLTTAVHFFDLTESAQPAFAERLSLEIKLPHDFFYPFFSRSSISELNNVILLIFFSALLF